MKRNTIIAAAAISLAVLSAAVSIYGASEKSIAQTENPVVSSQVAVDTAASTETQITVEKAIEIAQADVKTFTESDQTVVKSKLDYDNGRHEYDIKIVADNTKYDYEIDAVTGNINERDIEKVKSEALVKKTDNSRKAVFDESLYITEEAAKTAALEYAKVDSASTVFTECKLDYDDGIVVYEIEFYVNQTEYEVEIDAVTGTVTEFEIDD